MRFLPLLTLVAALALAGCVHVPADRHAAAGPDFAQARVAPAVQLPDGAWPAEQWWRDFRDPQLDALVDRALAANPTLGVAQARIASARAAAGQAQAEGGLSVDAPVGFNRQRYSANGFFPPPIGGAWFNDANVAARASYDFDWWGKHRALVAAALGEQNAAAAQGAQARQLLAASVAQSYFRLQLLWARADNVNALIAIERDLLAGREKKMAHGLLNQDVVQTTRLDLGKLTEQAARFEADAAREREVLRALAGGSDNTDVDKLARTLPAPGADALPRTLGLELLARRPDLQAARWHVEAQLGRVAAGEAAFRPDINLVAAAGLDSVSLGTLLRYPSRTILGGATLDLPLFDNGRLGARLDAARTGRDELLAEYNQAVLDAVRDVAREAATLQGIAAQAQSHQEATAATRQLESNAEARLRRGLVERGIVLQARQETLRQHDVDLQLLDARLQSQVGLIKALGGGFRADVRQPLAAAATPNQH
jgi:multidrug efflux system outer membrane protein